MNTVFVFDKDPIRRAGIERQLNEHGYAMTFASTSEEAAEVVLYGRAALAGLLLTVSASQADPGWEIAKVARQSQPDVAIGYLSASGHRDWAMLGVPDSIVIATGPDGTKIPDLFFRLCSGSSTQSPGDTRTHTSQIEASDILQREREILHAHFQQTSAFIAFLEGPSHCFTFANDAYLRLVEREVVGKTVLEAFPEVVFQGFVEILDRVYASGEAFHGHGVEFNIDVDPDRMKQTILDLIYRPMKDASGETIGIFVEGTDLTETRIAQSQITKLQAELVHAARVNAMGLMASALAHELNQPLAAISNFISAATITARKSRADPAISGFLEQASQSTFRASDIIRRLRTMTVANSSTHKQIALADVIHDAIFIATIGRLNANVTCHLEAMGEVYADPVQIQQVVINFLQNAFDASHDPTSEIIILTEEVGGSVRCCVRDSGVGIPQDILARVFDSFVTSKTDGMGVGLSLSRTIIETHGGTVSARNNADGGATFCFTLPRA